MATSLRACAATAFLLISSAAAHAQTGAASVKVEGRVSGAVAVSMTESQALSEGAQLEVAGLDPTTVIVSVSGSGNEKARVRLPLRLRSNVGYELRASFLSDDAPAARLSIADIRATGNLVHADALKAVRAGESLAGPHETGSTFQTLQSRQAPLAILSGPPISKGGTFTSPDNAVEVVLNIEIEPRSEGRPWSTRLTISAAPTR